MPDPEDGTDAALIARARDRASSLVFAYRRRWNLSAADPALLALTETEMLIDLYADRLADDRELMRRNPGLADVLKFAADKQAQADMAEAATKWLADPATLARLRAIEGLPPSAPPGRRPQLSLGRRSDG